LFVALSKRQKVCEKDEWCIWIVSSVTVVLCGKEIIKSCQIISERSGSLEECVQFTELLKTVLASHIGTKQDLEELQCRPTVWYTDNSFGSCYYPKCRKCLWVYMCHSWLQNAENAFSRLKNIKMKEHHDSKWIEQSRYNAH